MERLNNETNGIRQTRPNPVKDELTIQVYSGKPVGDNLKLYNAAGRQVAQKDVTCNRGINTIVWNVSGLVAGYYTLGFTHLPVLQTAFIKD